MTTICIKIIRIYFYFKLYSDSLNQWIAQIMNIEKLIILIQFFDGKYFVLTILFY